MRDYYQVNTEAVVNNLYPILNISVFNVQEEFCLFITYVIFYYFQLLSW